MLTSPDFRELLKLFDEHEVRYLIVGGYAVMRYAEPRFYQMGNPPMRVDVMMDVPGVDFVAAWPRRETVMIGDTPMHFIGKQDLIASKRAAGRPKDLLDLESLEADL